MVNEGRPVVLVGGLGVQRLWFDAWEYLSGGLGLWASVL